MNAEWAKLIGAIVTAVLLNFGVEAASDRKDVTSPDFQRLEEQQQDDALYNCERGNDLRQEIRETLLEFDNDAEDRRSIKAALNRFEIVNCNQQVGGET